MSKEDKVLKTHTTKFCVTITVVEHVFFDTGKKFWDVVLFDKYNEGGKVFLDCKNKTAATKLFNLLKEQLP